MTDIDLGATTTTGDPEGDVVERHPAPTELELDAAVELLRGPVELQIPAASAVKIDGERAYRLARRGVQVEMPSRRSVVHALSVEAYDGTTVRLSLHVGSGTYVRSLAQALGGHCTTLRRTAVGPFTVDEADGDAASARLLGVDAVLARLPAEALDRVPERVRAGVLAAAATGGEGAA
jgi:tRNA pseudouridine55 synthase